MLSVFLFLLYGVIVTVMLHTLHFGHWSEFTYLIPCLLQPTVPAEGRSSPRIGNIGHLTRISNKLVQLGNNNSEIQAYLQVYYWISRIILISYLRSQLLKWRVELSWVCCPQLPLWSPLSKCDLSCVYIYMYLWVSV